MKKFCIRSTVVKVVKSIIIFIPTQYTLYAFIMLNTHKCNIYIFIVQLWNRINQLFIGDSFMIY